MKQKIFNLRPIRYALAHKVLSIIVIIVVLIGIFLLRPKAPPQIDTEAAQHRTIEQTVAGTGTIDSKTTANLTFPIGGRLTYLGVKKGDSVSLGQTIATLDLRSVQKNIESVLIDYSKQRLDFDSTKETNGNRTPEQALNDTMKRALQDNQYDLNKTILSVEIQDLTKQNSILWTPIAGVVTRADVQTAGVTVGSTTIFTVADPNNVVFKTDVDESDVGKIKIGQNIHITLDAYPSEMIKLPVSSVDFASHQTSTGATAYTVEASIPTNPNMKYRIGMGGDAEIVLQKKDNALSIPLSALVNDKYVFVKTGTTFTRKSVVLGLANDTHVEVKSGVQKGDLIVTQPTQLDPKLLENIE